MRRSTFLLPLALSAALAATCVGCTSADGPAPTGDAVLANAEAVDFDVEGMTCASCEVSIKMALKKVEGVVEVSADAEAGSAHAKFDPTKTDGAALAAAITKLGYAATVRTADAGGN